MRVALLLELEGVVLETAAPRRQALLAAFAAEGIRVPEHLLAAADRRPTSDAVDAVLAAVREWSIGVPALDDTARELVGVRAERLLLQALARGVTLAPGAAATLPALASQARLALFARLPRADVERLLGHAGLDACFDVIVAAGDGGFARSRAELYRTTAERLRARLAPAPVARDPMLAVFADGPAAVRDARAAGLPVIAVGDWPAHEALEADALVPSLRDVTVAGLTHLLRGSATSDSDPAP